MTLLGSGHGRASDTDGSGFQVELVHTVSRENHGFWFSLCADGRGDLYASDQYGPIYRVTPPPTGSTDAKTMVRELPLPIGGAHGMAWVDQQLYVVVGQKGKARPGLWRISDADGDGELDRVELLRELEGEGEHGPHDVLPVLRHFPNLRSDGARPFPTSSTSRTDRG